MRNQTRREAVHSPASELASVEWRRFLDKTAQSSLLLVVTKLVAAWVYALWWEVPMHSRFVWGFIPFAGLQTTATQFRTLAAWSTATTAVIAVVWALAHFLPNRTSRGRLWGASTALPMAILLTLLEWWRRFDGDHLLPQGWLVRIVIGVLVPSVLILGFVERRTEMAASETTETPESTETPDTAVLSLTH